MMSVYSCVSRFKTLLWVRDALLEYAKKELRSQYVFFGLNERVDHEINDDVSEIQHSGRLETKKPRD